VKKLNAKSKIKLKRKCNAEMKVKSVMWNEWIDGLTINHNPTPSSKQEQMRALEAKEMESSFDINLKDVL
jgi:hypothetical protein